MAPKYLIRAIVALSFESTNFRLSARFTARPLRRTSVGCRLAGYPTSGLDYIVEPLDSVLGSDRPALEPHGTVYVRKFGPQQDSKTAPVLTSVNM